MVAWEQDVIEQVLAGNRGAYGRLVREYERPIRHSMARILGDVEGAQDVTQDAFLAAYEHLDSFDPSGNFFSWLYRIAWNRAINCHHREQRRRPLRDVDLATDDPNPEDRILAREKQARVTRAITRLPSKYLIVVVLRHYMDRSYREIAELTDLPQTTVRSRIHTARRLLAKQLK